MKTAAEIIAANKQCSCGQLATKQTVRGEEAERAGHLPQNHGYYCDACWDEGDRIERQAMYG